jgi:ribokinase
MVARNGAAVVIIGGANYDYLGQAQSLPSAGQTVHGTLFQEAPGGKGANQAVAAARFGTEVTFVGCVGDDERGEAILTALAAEGIELAFARREPTAATGVALIHVNEKGQKQILVAPGANEQLSVADVLAATDAIAGAQVLLVQLEVPVSTVMAALRLARQAGVLTVLDAAPPVPLDDDFLGLVDVLRANAGEMEVLTGTKVADRQAARAAIEQIRERGVGAAVVEAGGEGNLLVGSTGEVWLPLLDVNSVDSTGAGDAFAGALAATLAEGREVHEAARLANAAAALATTRFGAQASLPRREKVDAFLEEISRAAAPPRIKS